MRTTDLEEALRGALARLEPLRLPDGRTIPHAALAHVLTVLDVIRASRRESTAAAAARALSAGRGWGGAYRRIVTPEKEAKALALILSGKTVAEAATRLRLRPTTLAGHLARNGIRVRALRSTPPPPPALG